MRNMRQDMFQEKRESGGGWMPSDNQKRKVDFLRRVYQRDGKNVTAYSNLSLEGLNISPKRVELPSPLFPLRKQKVRGKKKKKTGRGSLADFSGVDIRGHT